MGSLVEIDALILLVRRTSPLGFGAGATGIGLGRGTSRREGTRDPEFSFAVELHAARSARTGLTGRLLGREEGTGAADVAVGGTDGSGTTVAILDDLEATSRLAGGLGVDRTGATTVGALVEKLVARTVARSIGRFSAASGPSKGEETRDDESPSPRTLRLHHVHLFEVSSCKGGASSEPSLDSFRRRRSIRDAPPRNRVFRCEQARDS
jgi:hypothetical protein